MNSHSSNIEKLCQMVLNAAQNIEPKSHIISGDRGIHCAAPLISIKLEDNRRFVLENADEENSILMTSYPSLRTVRIQLDTAGIGLKMYTFDGIRMRGYLNISELFDAFKKDDCI